MTKQTAEGMVKDIGEALGLDPNDARKAARHFIRKARRLNKRPPEPDHTIRERGDEFEVVLGKKNKTKAQEILSRHVDRHSIPGTWKIEEVRETPTSVRHVGRKQPVKKSSKPKSLEERFQDLPDQAKTEKLEKLKEMM